MFLQSGEVQHKLANYSNIITNVTMNLRPRIVSGVNVESQIKVACRLADSVQEVPGIRRVIKVHVGYSVANLFISGKQPCGRDISN